MPTFMQKPLIQPVANLDHDRSISFDQCAKVMEKVDVEQKMNIRFFN